MSTHTTIRNHKLIELSSKRRLDKFHAQITDSLGPNDFILGRDYQTKYGIDIKFSTSTIEWDGISLPMHPTGYWDTEKIREISFTILHLVDGDETYIQTILDSKYDKQDLCAVSKAQRHLNPEHQRKLKQLLMKHELLSSGTLGEWPDLEVDVDLKPDVQPDHCHRPYRVPHVYLATLKRELDRLLGIGVLEKRDGRSPWCAPSFIIPKKEGRVRLITDFRELNKCIERRP